MDRNDKIHGSAEEFDASWKKRKESYYNHWTAGVPKNQVQFAFRQHWKVFQNFIDGRRPGKSLEVGCGRGTISSYFADAEWDTVLLDWSSAILVIAKKIFLRNGHKASFVCGDAYNLSFQDEEFDVVVSIGLFEHFQNVEKPLAEQWRVLRPGGWFLGYIVPDNPHSIQKYFNWFTPILKYTIGRFEKESKKSEAKEHLYRNDFFSKTYISLLEKYNPQEIYVSGMYSVPMISHSPDFPFSLLPQPFEFMLAAIFAFIVRLKGILTRRPGWLCSERMGQAFLVAAQKRSI